MFLQYVMSCFSRHYLSNSKCK